MDEPTDGLDPLGRSQIRELIEKLRQRGKSVFLNSHILQEVELVCDRVAIMAHGQVRAIGSIEDLIEQHSPAKTVDVWIEVVGDEEACRRLFVGPDVQSFESLGDVANEIDALDGIRGDQDATLPRTRFRVQLKVNQQSESDIWIDRIRASNISLISFQRQKLRLEDIFVQLVKTLESENSKL